MPVFDGYNPAYVDSIVSGSYGPNPVYKNTSNNTLITVPVGGGYEEIPGGAITGIAGPTGPTTTATAADVDVVAGYVEWSPWVTLPITGDWERWSTAFAPPSYRYNNYSVQLSGLMRYLGPNISNGNAILAAPLPSQIIPQYNQAISIEINGIYQSDFRVYKTTSPPQMIIAVYPDSAPLILNNSWISIDGLSYALD